MTIMTDLSPDAPQTSFTPLENLRVAWMHHYLKIDQHKVAASFGINTGRVNEACRAIGYAMSDPRRFLAIIERDLKPETLRAVEDALETEDAP